MLYTKYTLIFLSIFILLATSGFAQSNPLAASRSYKSAEQEPVAQGGAIVVTAPTLSEEEGVQFTAPIRTTSVTGQGVLSFQFDFQYDPAVIQANGCSNTGTVSQSGLLTCNVASPGLAHVNVFSSTPFVDTEIGGGVLVNLTFTVLGTNGQTSTLTLLDFFYNEGSPSAATVPGSVTIFGTTAAPVIVVGRVLESNGRPIRNAIVTLRDSAGVALTSRSNPFGYYHFEGVAVGETYVLSAKHKTFRFSPRVITLLDDAFGVDIVADESN